MKTKNDAIPREVLSDAVRVFSDTYRQSFKDKTGYSLSVGFTQGPQDTGTIAVRYQRSEPSLINRLVEGILPQVFFHRYEETTYQIPISELIYAGTIRKQSQH